MCHLIFSLKSLLPRLQIQATDLHNLKSLLLTLRDIKYVRAEKEEQLASIAECHRLLRVHNLEISTGEVDDFKSLRKAWKELLKMASRTERDLSRQRKYFKYITKVEAKRCSKEVENFWRRFETSGPKTVGGDLDLGLQLMKVS